MQYCCGWGFSWGWFFAWVLDFYCVWSVWFFECSLVCQDGWAVAVSFLASHHDMLPHVLQEVPSKYFLDDQLLGYDDYDGHWLTIRVRHFCWRCWISRLATITQYRRQEVFEKRSFGGERDRWRDAEADWFLPSLSRKELTCDVTVYAAWSAWC